MSDSAPPLLAEAVAVLADHVSMPVDARAKVAAYLEGKTYPVPEAPPPPDPRDVEIAALKAQLASVEQTAAPTPQPVAATA